MQIHDDIMCTGNTVSRPGSALRDCEANILYSANSMKECAAPLVSDAFPQQTCVCV